MSSAPDSRRDFLKRTGSLAAAGAAIQLASARVYGANERFRVATIGTGGQGQAHVEPGRLRMMLTSPTCVTLTSNGRPKRHSGPTARNRSATCE